jgi:hypothetical protein
MVWLVQGKRRYYYRARRVGKKVFTEYVGTGPTAEREAALDALRRARIQAEREEKKAQAVRLRGLEAEVLAFISLADLVSRMCLVAGGYRQHCKGLWYRLQLTKKQGDQLVADPRDREEGKQ